MNCQRCGIEIPDGYLDCQPCLLNKSKAEMRKLVLVGASRADFYQFKEALHVFDKYGNEHHSSPAGRTAWCGATAKKRSRSPLADVTFSTRTFLDKVSGVCKECLKNA